jgi:hypothetical protein
MHIGSIFQRRIGVQVDALLSRDERTESTTVLYYFWLRKFIRDAVKRCCCLGEPLARVS